MDYCAEVSDYYSGKHCLIHVIFQPHRLVTVRIFVHLLPFLAPGKVHVYLRRNDNGPNMKMLASGLSIYHRIKIVERCVRLRLVFILSSPTKVEFSPSTKPL